MLKCFYPIVQLQLCSCTLLPQPSPPRPFAWNHFRAGSVCWTHGQCALFWNSLKAGQQKTLATIRKTTKSSIWEVRSHYTHLCLFVLVLCYTCGWSLVGRADFCQTKEASFATTPTAPGPGALFCRLISVTGWESDHMDFLNSSAPDGFCSALHK